MKILKALLLLLALSPAAHAEWLMSPPVALALNTCIGAVKAVKWHCSFRREVHREVTAGEVCQAGRSVNSCHLVNKAADVFADDDCLEALATCLSANPAALGTQYCFKERGLIGANVGCDSGAHQDHLHVQPVFGCLMLATVAKKLAGVSCD